MRREDYWLVVILALGLAVRLRAIEHSGISGDVRTILGWASATKRLGLVRIYEPGHGVRVDYPPISTVVFATVQYLYDVGMSVGSHRFALGDYMKLPACLADLLTCVLLHRCVRRRGSAMALGAALIYALQPAVIYDSAQWGQTDSIFTLFLIGAVMACSREWWTTMGILVACSALTKPQAVIFFPFFAVFAVRSWNRAWKAMLGAGMAVAAVLSPFIFSLKLGLIWSMYARVVGLITPLSASAYNVWWLAFGHRARTLSDLQYGAFGLSARIIGFLAFFSYCGLLLLSLRRHPSRARRWTALWLVASCIALGFFMLETEMRERYFFPFLALALPAACADLPVAVLYLCLSATLYFNIRHWMVTSLPLVNVVLFALISIRAISFQWAPRPIMPLWLRSKLSRMRDARPLGSVVSES